MMADLVTGRVNKLIATEKYQDAMDNDKRTMLQTVMRDAKSDASGKFLATLKIEGRRAKTLNENLASAEGRLGSIEQKGDLGQPDKLYEMGNLDTKFKTLLKGVDKDEVENPTPIVESWYLKEDVTQSTSGNFSKRELALLQERFELSEADRKKFDKAHPEIGVNKLEEYFKANPDENAVMVLWGDAKILSKEAYSTFQKLVEELDIVDAAIPNSLRIPKGSEEDYFKYLDSEDKSSPEMKLILAKNDKLREFLGKAEITEPIKALELMVKHKAQYDEIEALGDPTSDKYIADELARNERIKGIKTGEFLDDLRRIEAYEKNAPEAVIEPHVEYMKILDKEGVGSESAEAMLYRVDNPEYNQWRQDLKPIDESKIPIWRVDVKYAEQDKAFSDLTNTP